MSLYLQALAQAVGVGRSAASTAQTAEPRPVSRYEDWPEGLTEVTEPPGPELAGPDTAPAPTSPPWPTEGPVVRDRQQDQTAIPARLPPADDMPATPRPATLATEAPPRDPPKAGEVAPGSFAAPDAKAEPLTRPEPADIPARMATVPGPAAPPDPMASRADAMPLPVTPVVPTQPDLSPPMVTLALPTTAPPPAPVEARPVPLPVSAPDPAPVVAQAAQPQPLVIEIGRIEIRLDAPAAPRPAETRGQRDARPVLSLADYLSAQETGGRRT